MRIKLLLLLFIMLISTTSSWSEGRKRVKIKYKSHTELDFSGNKVSGKIKAPAVFYIFQRKRAKEHQVISPPEKFDDHKRLTLVELKDELR